MLKKLICLSIASSLVACSGADSAHKGITPLEDSVVSISAYALDVSRRGDVGCLILTAASATDVAKLSVDQTIFVTENGKEKRERWDTENKGKMYEMLKKDMSEYDIVGVGSETIRSSCANAFMDHEYAVYWGSNKEVVPERENDCYIEMKDGEKFAFNECAVRVKFNEIKNFSDMEEVYPTLYKSIYDEVSKNADDNTINTSPLIAK